MKNKISIIVGGTGQLGINLAKLLLKKNYRVFITTRNIKLAKKKISFNHKNLNFKKLNILNQREIKKLPEWSIFFLRKKFHFLDYF